MNLQFAMVRTKINKALLVVVSVLLIFASCCIPLTSLAADVSAGVDSENPTVKLPFPAPDTFGSDTPCIVTYDYTNKLYQYFVVQIIPYSGYDINSIQVQFNMTGSGYDFTTMNINIFNRSNLSSSGDMFRYYIYRFAWYPQTNPGNYSFSLLKNGVITASTSSFDYTRTFTCESRSVRYYGKCTFTFSGLDKSYVNNTVNYVFANEINPDEISFYLDYLCDISHSQLRNLDEITLYTSEILNELKSMNGNDFTTVPDTTNAVVNNYDSNKDKVIGDSFNKVDSAANALPNLNSFNSGNQSNAFKFISSNIEFFSGMNSSGSVSKIATVMFVILGLGLASFVIGLTNRRKG